MDQQLFLLKQFVDMVKVKPSMLHKKELSFFKEFIESFGGKIPEPEPTNEAPKSEEKTEEPKKADEPMPAEEEVTIPLPELDESGVVEPDTDEPLPMGDENKEPSEEELEKAQEERGLAQAALSDGDYDKAIGHFTAAIKANPSAAVYFAKRAQCLIQKSRPLAAIRDCDRAIQLNADSAIAYKFRGRAHRLLGHWVQAHTDLAMACKLDYSDDANDWLKEVEPNAKKMKEYTRAVERQKEEKELAERRERVRRAQEENAKARAAAAAAQDDDDMGEGVPGGMGGLGGLFSQMMSDPEMQEAMKDPEVLTAVMEIMQDPSKLMKHMGNPKVMNAFSKMKGMFGGADGGHEHAEEGGCCGGHDAPPASGTCPAGGASGASAPPPSAAHAPMPDLD